MVVYISVAKQYKIEIVEEGIIGSMLLGASGLPTTRMEQLMNHYAHNGWEMHFMVVEKRRLFLFWSRESVIITFVRESK